MDADHVFVVCVKSALFIIAAAEVVIILCDKNSFV